MPLLPLTSFLLLHTSRLLQNFPIYTNRHQLCDIQLKFSKPRAGIIEASQLVIVQHG